MRRYAAQLIRPKVRRLAPEAVRDGGQHDTSIDRGGARPEAEIHGFGREKLGRIAGINRFDIDKGIQSQGDAMGILAAALLKVGRRVVALAYPSAIGAVEGWTVPGEIPGHGAQPK